MEKKFKVLNIDKNISDRTGIEMLIVELAELRNIDLGPSLNFQPEIYGISGKTFIISYDSELGDYILNNPEEIKTIDLSEFRDGILNTQHGRKNVLYHIEYIEQSGQL